jgi:hypothetical protein
MTIRLRNQNKRRRGGHSIALMPSSCHQGMVPYLNCMVIMSLAQALPFVLASRR